MDPNNNLISLRANVQTALGVVYSPARKTISKAMLIDLLMNIAEDFDNLDEWLSKGGFQPDAWKQS